MQHDFNYVHACNALDFPLLCSINYKKDDRISCLQFTRNLDYLSLCTKDNYYYVLSLISKSPNLVTKSSTIIVILNFITSQSDCICLQQISPKGMLLIVLKYLISFFNGWFLFNGFRAITCNRCVMTRSSSTSY